ncbi:MAG: transcriptional regulator [Clostridia bacterium]
MKNELTAFGRDVKARLVRDGMEHRELARRIGCGENYLSMILHGTKNGGRYTEIILRELEELERKQA